MSMNSSARRDAVHQHTAERRPSERLFAVIKMIDPAGRSTMKADTRMLEGIFLERLSMEVYCRHHPMSGLRRMLDARGISTAAELGTISSGKKVLVSGLVIFFHTPPTRSGRRIIFATLEDETGLLDIVILPQVQARWAGIVYTSEVLTLQGRLLRQGRQGISISVTAERIIPELSGSFTAVSEIAGQCRNTHE